MASSSGLTVLMIGAIFWLITTLLSVFEIFGFYYFDRYYFYSGFWPYIRVGLSFLTALLILIGFVLFRGQYQTPISGSAKIAQPPFATTPQLSARFCPKCGKHIPSDAKFCPFCGWQAQETPQKKS